MKKKATLHDMIKSNMYVWLTCYIQNTYTHIFYFMVKSKYNQDMA